jgi:hypothetical protein
VPTHDQVLVPETLLKKRKSQEKAREERATELEKKKKVSSIFLLLCGSEDDGDAELPTLPTRHYVVDAVAKSNLSGLNRQTSSTLIMQYVFMLN